MSLSPLHRVARRHRGHGTPRPLLSVALPFVLALALTSATTPALLAQSGLDFIEDGQPTSTVLDRSHARLHLVDPALNLDPAVSETVAATVSSQATGDSETVTLLETDPASGIFEGRFQISPEPAVTGDGLLSSQWLIDNNYNYSADQLDASAAGWTASVSVEAARGYFIDRYGRETATVALGESVYARVHAAGVDGPLEIETLSFDVRDLSTGDADYTSLEDPPIVDIYEGGDLQTATGSPVYDDRILQTALGHTLRGTSNHIVSEVVDEVTVTASRTAFVDAISRPLFTRRPGQSIFVEVFDSAAAGSVTVTVDTSQSLDSEDLTLVAVGGGLFRGELPTTAAGGAPQDGALNLHAQGGDVVTATYADGNGGSSESLVTLAEAPQRSALFVVGQTTLGAGDQAVYDRLTGAGWSLAVVDDGASTTPDAWPHDLVLISSTVSSNQVGSKFRDVAIPVLVWEPYVLDNMAMTAASAGLNYGSELNQTEITIRDTGHPLSAGLAGSVTVTTTAGKLTYGRSGARAQGVARVGTRSERLSTFGYEEGEAMVGLDAPARRVSTFLSDTTAASLTADGWQLFDAAVCWAVRCEGEPLALFTTSVGGPNGRTVTFDASASQAFDGATLADFEWTFGDRHSGDGASITHIYQPAFYSDEHGFLATLKITDSLGRTATASQVMWLSPAKSVLFITRTELLDAGDAAIVERLRLHGHRAVVKGHSGLTAADAQGHDSLFISSSVQSNQLGATFKNTAIPVAIWETHLFDDMALTASGAANYGRDLNQPGVDMTGVFHPITEFGSFFGELELDALGSVGWGKPGPDADVLATSPADSTHAALFAYDDHHQLADGVQAPHRRVGLWLGDDSAAVLTPDGRRLLDGVIPWIVDP